MLASARAVNARVAFFAARDSAPCQSPQPFDHPEYMLYASADAGLVAVLGPLRFIDHPLRRALVGEVFWLGRFAQIRTFWLA